MAEVSYLERQPYIDSYTKASHDLCYGVPSGHGSLLTIRGPLRAGFDRDNGLRYWLEHERDLDDESFRPYSSVVSNWNLDFSLPTVVRVAGDDSRRVMPIETFVEELCQSLGQEGVSEFSVRALSLGIRACYESIWLESQQKELLTVSRLHAGKNPKDVEDARLHALAVDVALRSATIDKVRSDMWENIAKAHNIARTFPGTTAELMHDRAMRAITRPEHEPGYGQFAMTEGDAIAMLELSRTMGAQ